MPDAATRRTALIVPWRTLLKIIGAVALVWLCLQLVQLFLVLVVAVILAVTLNPIVRWFEQRGAPRWAASTLVGLLLLGLAGGFLWGAWASLSSQASYAMEHFSQFERQLLDSLPGWVRKSIGTVKDGDLQSFVGLYAVRLGQSVLSALVVTFLGFILMLYLLIEGEPTRDWLIAFVPKTHRSKVEQTLTESERVIFAYVAANVITSICAAAFVWAALSILKVPGALLLAIVAGVFDFVPVMGFILSSVFAVMMALTVSGTTALTVLVLYAGYHLVENYLLAPWAYGDRLKLSNVAVVLAFAVGAELAGVIGALIALPVAAVYPAIERIWLREQLPGDTVSEHKAIEHRLAG
jgi:predicted PurR-regulated permease PerM